MPHVMKYSEILKAADDGEVIYEEIRATGIVRPLKFDGVDLIGVKHNCCLPITKCNGKEYNVFYRCWDEEPSEKLMNETSWSGTSEW